jgi:hypothetical protein
LSDTSFLTHKGVAMHLVSAAWSLKLAKWSDTSELGRGDSSIGRLGDSSERTVWRAILAETRRDFRLIQREAGIPSNVKQPLTRTFHGHLSE